MPSPFSDASVPSQTIAATDTTPVLRCERSGKISAVSYIPDAAITGANTDTRKVSLVNTGAAGIGTTEIAAIQFNSGVNGVQDDEKALTLSSTPADLVVAAGDVLVWKSAAVGNGLVDPGGLVRIQVDRV